MLRVYSSYEIDYASAKTLTVLPSEAIQEGVAITDAFVVGKLEKIHKTIRDVWLTTKRQPALH